MASLSQIFNWFRIGAFPSEQQFKDTFSSFWHKSEKIPQSQIFGLQETIESSVQGLIWKDKVTNVSDLATTYPAAQKGWAAMVTSVGYIYSYNGTAWVNTGLRAFPDNVAVKDDIAQLESEVNVNKDGIDSLSETLSGGTIKIPLLPDNPFGSLATYFGGITTNGNMFDIVGKYVKYIIFKTNYTYYKNLKIHSFHIADDKIYDDGLIETIPLQQEWLAPEYGDMVYKVPYNKTVNTIIGVDGVYWADQLSEAVGMYFDGSWVTLQNNREAAFGVIYEEAGAGGLIERVEDNELRMGELEDTFFEQISNIGKTYYLREVVPYRVFNNLTDEYAGITVARQMIQLKGKYIEYLLFKKRNSSNDLKIYSFSIEDGKMKKGELIETIPLQAEWLASEYGDRVYKVPLYKKYDFIPGVEGYVYKPSPGGYGAIFDNQITDGYQGEDVAIGAIYREESTQTKGGRYNYDINHILAYGQSLSAPPNSMLYSTDFQDTLMFTGGIICFYDMNNDAAKSAYYGSGFLPIDPTNIETTTKGTALVIKHLIEKENGIKPENQDYTLLCSSSGIGNANINLLQKGYGYNCFERLIESVKYANDFAIANGKTYNVPALFWLQGEADRAMSKENYYSLLNQLFSDLNTDIKAITNQAEDVQFITYQVASLDATVETGASPDNFNGPALAQLQLVLDKENVHLGATMYQCKYGDAFHLFDAPAYRMVGGAMGVVAKRLMVDNILPPMLYPKNIAVIPNSSGSKFIVSLIFDVPVKPLMWDTETVAEQPNYGFSILDASGEVIESVSIQRGEGVSLICSRNPSGKTLYYAKKGRYGAGNLRDSQGDSCTVNVGGIEKRLDNWLPMLKIEL